MTTEEKKLMDLTAQVWNEYINLPEYHPDNKREFMFHLHALQNIIFARDGVRNFYSRGDLPPILNNKP